MFQDPAPAVSRCMAAGVTAWEIPQKSAWAVTSNNLGPTLALCPCICIFPRLKLYFQLLSLCSSVVSLHSLRPSVCWEKPKKMKLKIQSLTLHKESITAQGKEQAALRECSLGWIRVWTLSCWGQTSWVLRSGGVCSWLGSGRAGSAHLVPGRWQQGPLCAKGLGSFCHHPCLTPALFRVAEHRVCCQLNLQGKHKHSVPCSRSPVGGTSLASHPASLCYDQCLPDICYQILKSKSIFKSEDSGMPQTGNF